MNTVNIDRNIPNNDVDSGSVWISDAGEFYFLTKCMSCALKPTLGYRAFNFATGNVWRNSPENNESLENATRGLKLLYNEAEITIKPKVK